MKKLTENELVLALRAVNSYLDQLEHAKSVLVDKGEVVDHIFEVKELRVKLILGIDPIEVKGATDLFKVPCILCGESTRGDSPTWAFVAGDKICHECFKKYSPIQYAVVTGANEDHWKEVEKIESETELKDIPVNVDSDLPF